MAPTHKTQSVCALFRQHTMFTCLHRSHDGSSEKTRLQFALSRACKLLSRRHKTIMPAAVFDRVAACGKLLFQMFRPVSHSRRPEPLYLFSRLQGKPSLLKRNGSHYPVLRFLHLSQLFPVLPGILPGAVISGVANGVIINCDTIKRRQLVLPTGVGGFQSEFYICSPPSRL